MAAQQDSKPGNREGWQVTEDQAKISKAIEALEGLVAVNTNNPAVKPTEEFVKACSVLAVLKGTTPMPEFWTQD